MLADNAFVKSTNSVTDEVEEYPPAITDMEAIVAIHGEFDKYAIEEWLDAEAKKAVEAERERILSELDRLDGDGTEPTEDRRQNWFYGYADCLSAIRTFLTPLEDLSGKTSI